MFNRIKSTAYVIVAVADHAREERAYRKERRTRQGEVKAYDNMIAESQNKIGPYVPTPCPVQIWA